MKTNLHIFLLAMLFLSQSILAHAEITIAVIAPKAGIHQTSGTELINGAKIAVDEINQNGGLNGEKVDMLTIDDRCDDNFALSTAQMLTLLNSKKIGLVMGPFCANRFTDVAKIYEDAKIFQIVPTTMLYQKENTINKETLLLLGTNTQMSKDFFKFYNANFAGLKTGFVYDDTHKNNFSQTASSLFNEFKRYGKSSLLKFYTINTNTPYDLADKIIADDIEIIFIMGTPEDSSKLIKYIKDKDSSRILFTTKDIFEKAFPENRPDNIYVLGIPGIKDSLMFTEDLVNLRLLGVEPKGLEIYSYVAVKLWDELIKKNNSFSYNLLKKDVNTGETKEKWSKFLMHSGSFTAQKYIIEQSKDNTYKQVY